MGTINNKPINLQSVFHSGQVRGSGALRQALTPSVWRSPTSNFKIYILAHVHYQQLKSEGINTPYDTMNESNSFKYIPAMAMIQTPSEIEARLQALINSTSLQLPTCMDDNGPLVIFYAHRDIAAPDLQSHHFFLTLTTGRSQVLFREFEAESLLHETLENRVIFHIDVHDSNLRNCTLISCAVHGGRFEACHFIDCQFAEKKLSIDERGNVSNSKAQIISHSHVENGSMCDAEISNSSLKSVNRLRNCQLNNSLLVESVASESSFNNCGIHDSKLHNCTVVDGLQTDSVISTITTFRAFPAEIRKMIYEEILENDEAALGLMAAFRPDSLLYGEILELCFQRVTFVLSSKNLKALKSTPDFVRRRITKIKLK